MLYNLRFREKRRENNDGNHVNVNEPDSVQVYENSSSTKQSSEPSLYNSLHIYHNADHVYESSCTGN